MKKPLISLSDISVYIPESRMHFEEVIQLVRDDGIHFRMSDQAYYDNGFQYVPVEKSLSLEQMIYKTCLPILQKAVEQKISISTILFASVSNTDDQHNPIFAKLIHDFGLEQTPVIQLEEYGCSSIHLAFRLVEQYFTKKGKENEGILFVTADKAKATLNRCDSYMVFGDAASAILFRAADYGQQQLCAVQTKADGIVFDDTPERIKLYFSMFFLGIRQVVNAVLRENSLVMMDIKIIFCTNLGLQAWTTIARSLGCPVEKFYAETLYREGHLHNTDIIHNMNQAINSGYLQKGDYYLTVSVGFGGYYGCGLHRFC